MHARRDRLLLVALVCGLVTGCAETTAVTSPELPVAPGRSAVLAPDGGPVPTYNSAADIPNNPLAEVKQWSASGTWEGQTIVAEGLETYFGNRGTSIVDLTVIHNYSTVFHGTQTKNDWHLPLWEYTFSNFYLITTAQSCDQTASINGTFKAASVATFLDAPADLTRIEAVEEHGYGKAIQPACPTRDIPEPMGDGGGSTGGGPCVNCGPMEDPSRMTCLVRFTYDLDTGVILDAETLYCW